MIFDAKIIKLDSSSGFYESGRNCDLCGKDMILHSSCVALGQGRFHLICYKNNLKTRLDFVIRDKEAIEQELKIFEKCNKEMICESLEGIGEK